MSDAEASIAPVATTAEDDSKAPAESVEAAPIVQAAAPEPVPESAIEEGGNGRTDLPVIGADEDSEAETLIQSPEKQKNVVEGAPRLEPPYQGSEWEGDSEIRVEASPSEDNLRKRKRSENDVQDAGSPNDRASSRRSSPLSSPVPDTKADDSESDNSSSNAPKHIQSGGRRRDESDRKSLGEPEEKRARTSGQPRIRKRRPSDIPTRDLQHRSTRQKQSLDGSSNQDRRETRSATYPRQSSNDRSLSPEPARRREHRRVASTQVGSSIALTKKRRIPAPLITTHPRRNQSSDRRSVSSEASSSPAPSRPPLHKVASTDNDAMSPAKGPTGPRKFRDKNGRTFLARACSNNDLEGARSRFEERPQDLNVADNAGNTALQIASLEGFVDIVEFLLEQNCEVDTKNIDKETPLIDAVENGHVEVVKLLLSHGANPRLGNAKGDEPYELVQHDDESSYQAIRKLIEDAKAKDTRRRRSDDQEFQQKEGSSRAASAASPRDSPPLGPRSPPALASRRRTGRSDFTRNDLLWQANTQENLTKLAGRGDVQGVASILNILQKAETESLIAAAKGGHDEVLQYLLGMGDPDPDPDPVRSEKHKSGYNTPMLAAIGRGNTAVVKLLVEQSGFNPTREFRGRTYPELSQDRKGVDWQEEFRILKAAYDEYKGSKARKHGSPRKSRDVEKSARRQVLLSSSPLPTQRKSLRSPEQSHRDLPGKVSSNLRDGKREVKREPSGSSRISDDFKKKGRDPNSGDHNVAVSSDHDANGHHPKSHKKRRSQSDLHTADSENAQKRRRLISGKEHRRRASLAGADAASDEEAVARLKSEGKAKPTKRLKDSASPESPRSRESDVIRLTVKKRRTVHESSPEEVRSTKNSYGSTEKLTTEEPNASPVEGSSVSRDTVKVHSDIDEAFKQSQEQRSEPPAVQPRRDSVHAMEGIETNVTEEVSDEEQVKAEQRAKAQAEEEAAAAAAEVERLAKEEELNRIQAEKDAAALAARQIEEERLAGERKKADEAAAKKKAEDDAIARKREEEERLEKMKRDAEERQRRQEERRQREFLENERRRQEALPSRLRRSAVMLDQDDPEAKSHAWLSKFLPLLTVRSSQIVPALEHLKRGLWEDMHPDDEEWISNFQAAYLLGTKDLNLRSYTSLERRDVTNREKEGLWKVSRIMLSFDYHAHAYNTTIELAKQKELEERPKFMAMQEVFWVKLSDFQDQVERHAHLRGLNMKKQRIGFYPIPTSAPTTPQSMESKTAPNGISPVSSHDGLPNGMPGTNGIYRP